MPVLDEKRFPDGGPYADFCDLKEPLNIDKDDWPCRDMYGEHIFYKFSESLIDTICLSTRTYLPFDQYELTEFRKSHEILELSSQWIIRAHILMLTPTNYLSESLGDMSLLSFTHLSKDEMLRSFHRDLIDTLLYLSQKLNDLAFSNRCLTIVGY